MPPYRYTTQGRSPRTMLALAAAWIVLIGVYVILDASLWILGLLALTTVPAILDIWRNPVSGLTLDDQQLTWRTGRRSAQVGLEEIKALRLDRTWDFSIRASVVLQSGKKIRLPVEATPADTILEAELINRGISVERHPFSIF